jgi:hypothetical protein
MSLLKLQKMIDDGRTWYYRNQAAVIKSFDNTHGEIEILVELNGNPQKFIKESEGKVGLFLDSFKPVPVVEDIKPVTPEVANQLQNEYMPVIYRESKETFKTLSEILLEDVKKVRENPAYVAQAKQVCNNVSALVNITKLQIEMLRKR